MKIYGINVDITRGFTVLKGKKELASFDSYEEARVYAAEAVGRWIRYYEAKEGK